MRAGEFKSARIKKNLTTNPFQEYVFSSAQSIKRRFGFLLEWLPVSENYYKENP
jgi:hypothetical protein